MIAHFFESTCNNRSTMLTCNTNWRCLHVGILYYRIFHPAVPVRRSVSVRHSATVCPDRPHPIPRMVLCPLHLCQRNMVCHAGVGSGLVDHDHYSRNPGNIVPILLTVELKVSLFLLMGKIRYLEKPHSSISARLRHGGLGSPGEHAKRRLFAMLASSENGSMR